MRINRQFNPGFTIIELMVVVVVIAVLTTLTMSIYTGIQAQVIDMSVNADIDRLNALEISYKSSHGAAGKAYYSGDGADSDLNNFTPKNGNIFDVVVNGTDYCIRGYNIKGTKNSILNPVIKESRPGVCAQPDLQPSAIATATPSVPDAPVVTVTMVGGGIQANITPVSCDIGTIQYSINSRLNDGTWEGYSEWSSSTTASRTADEGVKYGYQAQARCYIDYTSTASVAAVGAEGTYSNLTTPPAPAITVVLNGGNVEATISPVTCAGASTPQYGINSRINTGAWTGWTAWSSTTTASQAATGGQGVKYEYQAQARCYISDSALSIASTGDASAYISPIATPVAPTLSTSTTAGYVTTYSWGATACAAGTTARYQYKLTVAPSGFDSGWAATAGLSAVFTTSTGDQTYTVQTQAQCYNDNTTSSWSTSGSASYFCIYNSVPIATSISGTWAAAPTDYLLEDGSAVSRTTYSDLFAVIGTTYGAGDGSTTFNLPDSRGRVAVNKNSADTQFDTMGEKYGEKSHILTGAETGTTVHGHTASSGVDSPDHTHTYRTEGGSGPPWYSHTGVQGSHFFTNYVGVSTGGASARHTHTVTVNNSTAANAASTHNTIQPSIVKVFAIKYRPATGNDSMLPASTSIAGYWPTVPSGYLLEDGSAVSRTTYSDLFAVIGTTYGAGDGSTTFNLPDSRGRVAVNKNPSDVEFDTLGEKYGEKAHLLTSSESGTAAHSHSASSGNDSPDHTHNYETEGGTGPPWYAHVDAQSSWYFYTYISAGSGGASARHTHTVTVNNSSTASASSAHNVIQPSIVKLFAIKYTPAAGALDNITKGTSVQGYFTTAPTGYLLEDGSAVSRAAYPALFAAIGTTYGAGDGSTTFNLPDSRGRLVVNKNPSDTEFDVIGEKFVGAEKVHLLTGVESGTSAHSHPASSGNDSPDHTHVYSREGGTGPPYYAHTDGQGSHYFYTYVATPTGGASARHTHTITVNNSSAANAASSHNNIQPSIVQNFAIRY